MSNLCFVPIFVPIWKAIRFGWYKKNLKISGKSHGTPSVRADILDAKRFLANA
jgi:hypothetical protein